MVVLGFEIRWAKIRVWNGIDKRHHPSGYRNTARNRKRSASGAFECHTDETGKGITRNCL
ncbi:MAG: hypothetical protein JW801_14790 [Bacteroidales bacterium]|nr:hypothetical protein [Bacteroidales bacterium]